MPTFASVLPSLTREISAALEAEGEGHLTTQLSSREILRVEFDPRAKAGFVRLKRPFNPQFQSSQFEPGGAPHNVTVGLAEVGVNIDVDLDGQIIGLELMGREDAFARLKDACALTCVGADPEG